MNLFDAFERIYLINLPERTDRLREARAELRKVGLAGTGDRLRIFPGRKFRDAGSFPSIGARGCYASHLAIVREAIRDGLNSILILEDDIMLDSCAATSTRGLAETLLNGAWDFCYPGHVDPDTRGNPSAPRWLETESPLVCAHFYGLNARVLPRLADYLQACMRRPPGHPDGGPMHIDGAYSMFRARTGGVVTLISSPSLGGQRSSRSDIYPNRWYDRLPVLRTAAGIARSAMNRARRVQKVARISGAA